MSLRKVLGVEHPIVQAPMAGVQGSALAIAVSNTGALGSLPAAMLNPDGLAHELEAIRAGTSAPVNVNFFCHTTPPPDPATERRWRELLLPYYRELALDADLKAPSRPGRSPFSSDFVPVLDAFRPEVVSFHFGLPSGDLLRMVRRLGITVLSTATTVDEARWLDTRGVDAIIVQGCEAGGHRGMFLSRDVNSQTGLRNLLPQVVSAVRVPVIAAGGIAGAEDVREMLTLGASGVQVGTAYLLSPEATTSIVHRQALLNEAVRARETTTSRDTEHTALTNLFTGRPARGLINRLMRELGPIRHDVPEFPLAATALAPLRARAESLGRGDFSPLWAGTCASRCREVTAAELTMELASD